MLRSRDPLRPGQLRAWGLILALAAPCAGGCAGFSARTLEARQALDQGQASRAAELYNKELQVKTNQELPADPSGDNALLVLDRSMILQQLEEYENSSRGLEVADKQLELLDFSKSAVEDIGKYLYSDDSGGYRAPPYEKLLLNTMNMVNYLARHDLNGARIEARRLAIMQTYLRDHKDPGVAMVAPGSYLAGFSFEYSGRGDEALRYYDEALTYGDFPSLIEPVARLSGETGFRTERLSDFLKRHEAEAQAALAKSTEGSGELLVLVNYGRVPAKVAKRIPIGLALTFGALYLSDGQSSTANQLAAQGLVTWVNYPELEEVTSSLGTPSVQVDGQYRVLESALAVDSEARKSYDQDKGRIIASAIVRLIARAAAGELARQAANDNLLGTLLSLGTQAALTAADTPDTRSWSTLPARITLARVRLPAGKHHVELAAQGLKKSVEVELAAGRWEAVVLTALR